MPSSRAFIDTPIFIKSVMYVGSWLAPVLQHITPAVRTPKASARNLLDLSIDEKFNGTRGYFVGSKAASSSSDSRIESLQEKLWEACVNWTAISQSSDKVPTV
jgi:hypothetical protein